MIAALQGVLTIDTVREHDLQDNAVCRGEQFHGLLADRKLSGVVDVRGRGLMLAVEFDTKDRREAVLRQALRRGLPLLGCGHSTLRVLPPLDVTERELRLGTDLLVESIRTASSGKPSR